MQASRRTFLTVTAAAPLLADQRGAPAASGFRYCLNTATLQGYKLGIVDQIDVAAKAGYQAIEPWLNAIAAYTAQGGSLPDLRKRIADSGLSVESAIAFAPWLVAGGSGLEQAKREMEIVAAIGGRRIAAPPAGA